MYANVGMFCTLIFFYDLGLAYSGGAQYMPSFSYINENCFILDLLLNKHLGVAVREFKF